MAYVRTRLGRWFYEEHGVAKRPGDPAIVLCHGLLYDGSQWSNQIGPLSELGRVVVFDGPGHGKSEVPPPFSLDDHKQAFVDALDALSIQKTILIGLSWGGMLALRVAIGHPRRVAAMALLACSADAETRYDRAKYRVLASFARKFGLPFALVQREIAPLMFGKKTLRDRPELVRELAHQINGYSRDGVARAAKAVVIKRPSILKELRAVSVPTLVLCGEEDLATDKTQSQAIASRIPQATLTMIEDAGHMSAIEQPARVNAALLPFVQANLSH
jgi:3-oxoadipate enol-lactonase